MGNIAMRVIMQRGIVFFIYVGAHRCQSSQGIHSDVH